MENGVRPTNLLHRIARWICLQLVSGGSWATHGDSASPLPPRRPAFRVPIASGDHWKGDRTGNANWERSDSRGARYCARQMTAKSSVSRTAPLGIHRDREDLVKAYRSTGTGIS